MIFLAAVLLILGVFLFVVGVLAATRKLPGNGIIGIRVPEVRKSRELWDTAHAVAGPTWIASGVSMLFAGMLSLTATGAMWIVVALAVVASLVLLGMGAGMGAHTVALIDAQHSESGCTSDSCDCGSGGCGDAAASDVPVDVDAARRAATAQDN